MSMAVQMWVPRPTTPLEVLHPAQEEMTLEGKHCPKSTELAAYHQTFSLNKKAVLSQQLLDRIQWHTCCVSSWACQVHGISLHLYRFQILSWHQDILYAHDGSNQELNSWTQDKCLKSEAILHRWNRNHGTGVVSAVGIPRWEWVHRILHFVTELQCLWTFLQCWSPSLTIAR